MGCGEGRKTPPFRARSSHVIPISPREYRERHPTGAGIKISIHDKYIRFDIYDDFRQVTTIDVGHGHCKWMLNMIGAAISERLI